MEPAREWKAVSKEPDHAKDRQAEKLRGERRHATKAGRAAGKEQQELPSGNDACAAQLWKISEVAQSDIVLPVPL